jgi:hypothetical protein
VRVKSPRVEICERNVQRHPLQVGGIELDPAVITAIDIDAVERGFEQGAVDHLGRNA